METEARRVNLPAQLRQTALSAAVSGALMLFFGFRDIQGLDSEAYNQVIDVFVWTLRIGGFAMLLSAALCLLQFPVALAYDALAAALIGLLLIGEALGMIAIARSADILDVLLLLFGVMFVRSGWVSWASYRDGVLAENAELPEGADPEEQPGEARTDSTRDQEPSAGDNVKPGELSGPADNSPPSGFLADLGKNEK